MTPEQIQHYQILCLNKNKSFFTTTTTTAMTTTSGSNSGAWIQQQQPSTTTPSNLHPNSGIHHLTTTSTTNNGSAPNTTTTTTSLSSMNKNLSVSPPTPSSMIHSHSQPNIMDSTTIIMAQSSFTSNGGGGASSIIVRNNYLLFPSASLVNLTSLTGNTSYLSLPIPQLCSFNKAMEILENAWDEDVLTSEEKDAITCFKQTKRSFTGNENVSNAELQNLVCADRFLLDVFLPMNQLMNENATTSSLTIGLVFLKDFNTIGEERAGILPLALQVGPAILYWSASRHVVCDLRTNTERKKLKLIPIARIEGTRKVAIALATIAKTCCRFNGKQYYDEITCNGQHFISTVLSKLNLEGSMLTRTHFQNGGYFEDLKRGQYKTVYFYSKSIKEIIKDTIEINKDNPKWREECAATIHVPVEDINYFLDNDLIHFTSRSLLDKFGLAISHFSIIGGFSEKYSKERSTDIDNYWVSEAGREDYDFLHVYDKFFDSQLTEDPTNPKYLPFQNTSFFFFDDDSMTTGSGLMKQSPLGELQKNYRIAIPSRRKIKMEE
nr:unnamed protein product [Naegleria fowleri]